jgi:hypothetical protein
MPRTSADSAAAVKRCREVKMLRACKPLESNPFCAISQNRERPCRSAAAATDRVFHSKKDSQARNL